MKGLASTNSRRDGHSSGPGLTTRVVAVSLMVECLKASDMDIVKTINDATGQITLEFQNTRVAQMADALSCVQPGPRGLGTHLAMNVFFCDLESLRMSTTE